MNKKERTIVKVDEEKIKRMIAGDEPYAQDENSGDNRQKEPGIIQVPDESNSMNRSVGTSSRKKPVRTDYVDTFLKTVRTNDKKQTSVQLSESVFRKMEILLKATKGLSMGLFINNVLIHHFDEYEEDIYRVREQYITKLSEDV